LGLTNKSRGRHYHIIPHMPQFCNDPRVNHFSFPSKTKSDNTLKYSVRACCTNNHYLAVAVPRHIPFRNRGLIMHVDSPPNNPCCLYHSEQFALFFFVHNDGTFCVLVGRLHRRHVIRSRARRLYTVFLGCYLSKRVVRR
jgi:hypothetical protein